MYTIYNLKDGRHQLVWWDERNRMCPIGVFEAMAEAVAAMSAHFTMDYLANSYE